MGAGTVETRSAINGNKTIVSIVVPFFNEEQALPVLVKRLQSAVEPLASHYEFEIILVDDGSEDRSLQIATDLMVNEPRLRVVELRRNYGQTAALQAGMDRSQGDLIITMDADLQHFPEEIPKFIHELENGYDVVCGWRSNRREGILRRWPSRAANYLLRKISGLTIHDIGTTYRAYRTEIVRDIQLLGEHHRFIPILAAKVGARITEIEIENVERTTGTSSYGLSRSTNVFIDLFFLFFLVRYLDRPLRLFGKISLFLFGLAGIIGATLGWLALSTGLPVVREHSGWFLTGLGFMIAGLQIILTGLISELVVRLQFCGDGRSYYKVRKEFPSQGVG